MTILYVSKVLLITMIVTIITTLYDFTIVKFISEDLCMNMPESVYGIIFQAL